MATYKDSGVDIDAGDLAVELMKASVARASRPEVMGGIGGFAGLFDASALKGMKQPLLATSTDGVGTKTEIARQMGIYDTIGEDLVAMVVDDLVVCGAEPLFMTDYIAVGKVIPERIAEIVSGIARGCQKANTALIGGETAEHPGLLKEDEFDIAGAATGVVDGRWRGHLQVCSGLCQPGHRRELAASEPFVGSPAQARRQWLADRLSSGPRLFCPLPMDIFPCKRAQALVVVIERAAGVHGLAIFHRLHEAFAVALESGASRPPRWTTRNR